MNVKIYFILIFDKNVYFLTIIAYTWIFFLILVPNVLSASQDASIKLWNIESGVCERTLLGHTSAILCLALTVNRARFLSGSFNSAIFLWDIATGQKLSSYCGHSAAVWCLAVTPDGHSFVSGSSDRTLKMWRFDEPLQAALTFEGHTDTILSVALSEDGAYVYSGSQDKSFRVWSSSTGNQITVSQWDAANSELVRVLHAGYVSSIAVTEDDEPKDPDEQDEAIMSAARATTIDYLSSVAVSGDGAFAASARYDKKTISVWEINSNSLRSTLRSHGAAVTAVLFL